MGAVRIGSPLTAFGRLFVYVGLTLLLMPAQLIFVIFDLPPRKTLPRWYHRRCIRILGLIVEQRGQRLRDHPVLYVSNHVSYFDITVLGSVIEGSFVAKAEVARWPLFGWLARLQNSIFVDRRGIKVADHRDEIGRRLEAGDDLILFPEGTSGDGNRILPFKSALFSAAERRPGGKPLAIQPISITYTRLDGLPMGRYLRPLVAWYGDMELASHIWQAAGLGWVTVVVEFHPAVTFDELGSRKALSDYCHGHVARGVNNALTGRSPSADKPLDAIAAT